MKKKRKRAVVQSRHPSVSLEGCGGSPPLSGVWIKWGDERRLYLARSNVERLVDDLLDWLDDAKDRKPDGPYETEPDVPKFDRVPQLGDVCYYRGSPTWLRRLEKPEKGGEGFDLVITPEAADYEPGRRSCGARNYSLADIARVYKPASGDDWGVDE